MHAQLWYDATDSEVGAWVARDPWDLVEKTDEMTVMRGHWRFSAKLNKDDYVERYKARWVVDGSQRETSIFAPTPSAGSLRTLISFAVRNGWHMHVIDVKNAYLNSKLHDTVAMMYQIKGYEDALHPFRVCKLKVGAYGLPEAAALWTENAAAYLESLGAARIHADSCIFANPVSRMLMGLHSDDMIITCENLEFIQDFKKRIASKWPIADKGPISNYLGVEIVYKPNYKRLYMNQRAKIRALFNKLERLCPQKAGAIPVPANTKLEIDSPPCSNQPLFLHVVGVLTHIAKWTRPDILLPVARLATKMRAPTIHHMSVALRLVKFIHETHAWAIKHSCDESEEMRVKCYADAGSKFVDVDGGRHMSGIIVFVGGNAVTWSARRQLIVTDDVCEAEVYALNLGLKMSLPYEYLMNETGVIKENEAVEIYGDNQSALTLAGTGKKEGSRHYEKTLFYLQDFVKRGEVHLKDVRSSANPADLFTKFADYSNFKPLCKIIKMVDATKIYSNRP